MEYVNMTPTNLWFLILELNSTDIIVLNSVACSTKWNEIYYTH